MPELLLILVIVVLLFGAKRLPDTAKAVGQSLKIFKKSIGDDDEKKDKDAPREVTSNSPDDVPPSTQTRSDEPNRTEL